VLLALDGLRPASMGARITYDADNQPIVTDGPFSQAKEVVGGYWIIQTKSKEEALDRRGPRRARSPCRWSGRRPRSRAGGPACRCRR
jgi:hypothetical protein